MHLEFGLMISMGGLLSVFSVMALIIVICMIMKRVFKVKAEAPEGPKAVGKSSAIVSEEIPEEHRLAAAAAVLAYMKEER